VRVFEFYSGSVSDVNYKMQQTETLRYPKLDRTQHVLYSTRAKSEELRGGEGSFDGIRSKCVLLVSFQDILGDVSNKNQNDFVSVVEMRPPRRLGVYD
jgi:hypothetical protein